MANEAFKNFLQFKSILTDNLLPATKTTPNYFYSLTHSSSCILILNLGNNRLTSLFMPH